MHGLFSLDGQGGLPEEGTLGQSRQWYAHYFRQQARASQTVRAESCGGRLAPGLPQGLKSALDEIAGLPMPEQGFRVTCWKGLPVNPG